jgi:hypothetical protein
MKAIFIALLLAVSAQVSANVYYCSSYKTVYTDNNHTMFIPVLLIDDVPVYGTRAIFNYETPNSGTITIIDPFKFVSSQLVPCTVAQNTYDSETQTLTLGMLYVGAETLKYFTLRVYGDNGVLRFSF